MPIAKIRVLGKKYDVVRGEEDILLMQLKRNESIKRKRELIKRMLKR